MILPKKINLANIPTPLEQIKFEGRKFFIKRDDLTGVELTGNKVRKLEYLLYQAEHEKADIIFTCGGTDSNHARATVIAAARRGIRTHLFLWGRSTPDPDGNLFLSKFFGAMITFLNHSEYTRVNEIMYNERTKYLRKGTNVFVIPEGGSVTTGVWGYASCLNEMNDQAGLSLFEGITVAAGTGGTAAGLLCGAAMLKLPLKIFAINVLYPANVIRKKILMLCEAFMSESKLNIEVDSSRLVVLDGYSKEGYKKISDDKIRLIRKFAQSTGILLDPAYTAKAFTAYYEHFIIKNKSSKNIFLHTGGIFGVFSKKKAYMSK